MLHFHARGAGSIPGQGNKIPHVMWWGQKKKTGTAVKYDHKTSTDNKEKYSTSVLNGGTPYLYWSDHMKRSVSMARSGKLKSAHWSS